MVEIRELVVRAIVVDDATPSNKTGGATPSAGGLSEEARALLIEDCVRQVLAILERQTER